MVSNFGGTPDYWVSMTLGEFERWTNVGQGMLEEKNRQTIKPGL